MADGTMQVVAWMDDGQQAANGTDGPAFRVVTDKTRESMPKAAVAPYNDALVREADALAAIKALQDRIDTLNSSLECEKRMRKDAEEDAERWRTFADALDHKKATARFGTDSKFYAYSRSLAADLDASIGRENK